MLGADTMAIKTNRYPGSQCIQNSTTQYRGRKNHWKSSWHAKCPNGQRGISVACGKRWPRVVRSCELQLRQPWLKSPEFLRSECEIMISQNLVPVLSAIRNSGNNMFNDVLSLMRRQRGKNCSTYKRSYKEISWGDQNSSQTHPVWCCFRSFVCQKQYIEGHVFPQT